LILLAFSGIVILIPRDERNITMGHFLAEVEIPVSHVKPTDTVSQIVNFAVRDWMDDPDQDRGSENAGSGFKAPLLTRPQMGRWVTSNINKIHRDSVVIPLVAEKDEKETTKKVKFTVSGKLATRLQKTNDWQAQWDLYWLVYAEYGMTLTKVTTIKFPKAKKAVAVTGTAKVVTRYMIVSDDKVVQQDFISQAAARAEAIRLVNSDEKADINHTDVEVRGYLVRDGAGRAIVKISRPEADTAEIELMLTFTEPKANAKVATYQVMFDYHS
jgi:hypothetical protein